MAASTLDHRPEEGVQGSLSRRRVRIHHHPHLPIRPNRLHGLLQGPQEECQGAPPLMEPGRGGEAVQILQQGSPPRELCVADFCTQGIEINGREKELEGRGLS